MTSRTGNVDRWRDDFRAALLARHVEPARVAGALAEVDEYCAGVGQRPDEAFGDPGAYARAWAGDLDGDALVIQIEADPQVPYGVVVGVHDACTAAGLRRIALAAR